MRHGSGVNRTEGQVWFPAHIWRLSTICNSMSMGSDILFWPLWVLHAQETHKCMQVHILIFFHYYFKWTVFGPGRNTCLAFKLKDLSLSSYNLSKAECKSCKNLFCNHSAFLTRREVETGECLEASEPDSLVVCHWWARGCLRHSVEGENWHWRLSYGICIHAVVHTHTIYKCYD